MWQILSAAFPLFDTICKHAIMFVESCLSGNSDVVRYVANHGVYFGCVCGHDFFSDMNVSHYC